MSCNCNSADPKCEPCAICTPPGVQCLPDCDPVDPCPEKIDLCCVQHSGEDQPCSDIEKGEPLCDLLFKFLGILFPQEECCKLEFSISLVAPSATTTSTTTTTTSTSTTTTSTSTTSSTTSTSSTTTTTTKLQGQSITLCYNPLVTASPTSVCECSQPE